MFYRNFFRVHYEYRLVLRYEVLTKSAVNGIPRSFVQTDFWGAKIQR